MAGFPLGAIGAGLGQFAEAYQRQQQNQRAAEMQKLRVQQFMQEQQDRKRQEDVIRGVGSYLRGAGGDAGGSLGGGLPQALGSLPGATRMPDYGQPTDLAPAITGGGAAAGGGLAPGFARGSEGAPPNENPTNQLIQRASQVTGFAPDQPLNVSDPQVKAKLVEAMIRGEQGGRLPVDPAMIQRVSAGGGAPSSGGGQQRSPLFQEAQAGARETLQGIDPRVYGRASLEAIMKRVDQTMPGADDIVKVGVVEQLQKLMAPAERERWEMLKMQHKDRIEWEQEQWSVNRQHQHELDLDERARKTAPGTILETDQGPMRVRPGSNAAEPITLPGGARVTGRSGTTASSGRERHIEGESARRAAE